MIHNSKKEDILRKAKQNQKKDRSRMSNITRNWSQNNIDIIRRELPGQIIRNKYIIGRLLDQGSCGQVYKVVELQNQELPLAMKVSQQSKQFGQEIATMRKIWKMSQEPNMKRMMEAQNVAIPEMKFYGLLIEQSLSSQINEDQQNLDEESQGELLRSYMIMPRLGINLEQYFEAMNNVIPELSVYSLGIKILTLLECVHEAGFVFNDLKLDNLMIGFTDKLPLGKNDDNEEVPISENTDVFQNCNINLVDFGFSSTYLDTNTGHHIQKQEVQTFRGNMIFASLNQLNFKITSRRDDVISLCYLMIYMLNRANLPGIDLTNTYDRNESFKQARCAKMNYTLDSLCDGKAASMKDVVQEVFTIGFKEKPNYQLIRELLQDKIDYVKSCQRQMMLPIFYGLNDTQIDDNPSNTEIANNTVITSYQDEIEPSISVNTMDVTMNINKTPVKPLGLSKRQQMNNFAMASTNPSEYENRSIEYLSASKPGFKRFQSMNQAEFSNILLQKLEKLHSEEDLDISQVEYIKQEKYEETIMGRFKSIFRDII